MRKAPALCRILLYNEIQGLKSVFYPSISSSQTPLRRALFRAASGGEFTRQKARPALQGMRAASALNFLHQESLDDIALFDILELLKGDAALIAGGNLLYAVLKALEMCIRDRNAGEGRGGDSENDKIVLKLKVKN